MFAMSEKIIEILVDLLRNDRTVRRWFLIVSALILILAASSTIAVSIYPGYFQYSLADVGPFAAIGSIFAIFMLLLVLLSTADKSVFENRVDSDWASYINVLGLQSALGSRPKGGQKKAQPKPEPEDIIDAIKGNLGQLLEYYVMNKGQAKSSFRASLTAVVVGFGTILFGIWLNYSDGAGSDNSVYLAAAAGIIMQLIGGGYFYLYNRSLIQLNFFFSRLALMQDTLLAIRLSESLPEGEERTRVLERLIFIVAERGTLAPAYLPDVKNGTTSTDERSAAQPG